MKSEVTWVCGLCNHENRVLVDKARLRDSMKDEACRKCGCKFLNHPELDETFTKVNEEDLEDEEDTGEFGLGGDEWWGGSP